jgi:hypothetical protein
MNTVRSRRGTVLILVLGLITLLMALLAGLAARVHNAGRGLETLRRHAQAMVMLQAAKIYIAEREAVGSPLTAAVTLGDLLPAGSYPAAFFADRLGWVRVRQEPAAGAGVFSVLSAGGGSAIPGSGKTSLTSGSAAANAYEIRYLHTLTFTPPGGFTLSAQPVGDYTLAW